jgi:chromosome segregation ATPase
MKDNLVKLIDGVVLALNALRTEVNVYFAAREKEKKDYDDKINEFNDRVESREADLNKREAELAPIEGVAAYRKKADETFARAEAELNRLEDEKRKFNIFKSTEIAKIDQSVKFNAEESKRLAEKEKNMEQEIIGRVKKVLANTQAELN